MIRDQNIPVFKKKGHSWILLGVFRGQSWNSSILQNVFPKFVLGVEFLGAKPQKILL